MTTAKYPRPVRWSQSLQQQGRRFVRDTGRAAFTLAVAVATHTVFPLLRAVNRQRIARGESIVLEDMAGPPQRQAFPEFSATPGDLSPNPGKTRKARHMHLEAYPTPDYDFTYRSPPISGNVINGRGETEPRRASHVFFGDGYGRAWGKLDWYFQVMENTRVHRYIVRMFWDDRRRVGPVSRAAVEMPPDQSSEVVKRLAREAGAALVGITDLTDDLCYEDFDESFLHAIAIAIPMDREEMLHAPSDRSVMAIMDSYVEANRIAIEVAEGIRGLGWPARACTNIPPDPSEVLHLPTAIQAGLGELGKHGSLITREYGANVRLAVVLTDLPLQNDVPVDIGVEDFCASCQICVENCPPHAIFDTKQLVRGVEKFYVDFDKCAPYFVKTGSCGICLEVCPWSEPGRGEKMFERLMKQRMRKSSSAG
ncbi:MAG: reductive dehalogenase domain-containing protein [Myxococcota bacterium]